MNALHEVCEDYQHGKFSCGTQEGTDFVYSALGHITRDPLVKKYQPFSSPGHSPGGLTKHVHRTPGAAVATQRMAAARIMMGEPFCVGQLQEVQWRGEAKEKGDKEMARRIVLGSSCYVAQTFLWRDDILIGAAEGHVPPHVFGREGIPYSNMVWVFEQAKELKFDPLADWMKGDEEVMSLGLHLKMQEDHLSVTDLGIIHSPTHCEHHPIWVSTIGFPFGKRWEPSDKWPMDEKILAMLSFLNSSYVSSDKKPLDRSDRRAIARQDKDEEPPEVHVVRLRTPENNANQEKGEEGLDWNHQWVVRGHHRAQWYPSIQQHKVIWIAPHVKGPENKPMLRKVYDVAR